MKSFSMLLVTILALLGLASCGTAAGDAWEELAESANQFYDAAVEDAISQIQESGQQFLDFVGGKKDSNVKEGATFTYPKGSGYTYRYSVVDNGWHLVK